MYVCMYVESVYVVSGLTPQKKLREATDKGYNI